MKTLTTLVLIALTSLSLTAQDYSSYNALLKKYVTSSSVNYKTWHAHDVDQHKLDQILTAWSKVEATALPKNDRAAFRINLYNAAMINTVLDHYPIKSVTKIGLINFSIFKKDIIQTPSGKISLDTLEKKQLLKDFPDARIHFAVNCASISCPPLRNEAFTGKNLEKQLNQQATQFTNSKEAVIIKGNTAHYSELFKWYKDDFKTSNPAIYINKYKTKKIPTTLTKKFQDYNWNLNAAK